jgi:hypothetical protein
MTDRDDELRSLWQHQPTIPSPLNAAEIERRARRLETSVLNASTQFYVAALMSVVIWTLLAILPWPHSPRLGPAAGMLGWIYLLIDATRQRRHVLRLLAKANLPSMTTYRAALEAQRASLNRGRIAVRIIALSAGPWLLAADVVLMAPNDRGGALVAAIVAVVFTLIGLLAARGARGRRRWFQRQLDEL